MSGVDQKLEIVTEVPERAMVIFAHPDDAEIGSGGVMAKWVAAGCEVTYVLCTNGSAGTADRSLTPAELARRRGDEQRAAADFMGVRHVVMLGYPDGELEDSRAFLGDARPPPVSPSHGLRPRPLPDQNVPAPRSPEGRDRRDRRRLPVRPRSSPLLRADHGRGARAAPGPRAVVLGRGRARRHRRRQRLDRPSDRRPRPSREPDVGLQRAGEREYRRAREATGRRAGRGLRLRARRGVPAADRPALAGGADERRPRIRARRRRRRGRVPA